MTEITTMAPFTLRQIQGLIKCVDEKIALNSDLYYQKKLSGELTKEIVQERLDFWQDLRGILGKMEGDLT